MITSVLLLVQPVTTVFLGAILLRELPSPFQLAGVGLVIGGIALATGSLGTDPDGDRRGRRLRLARERPPTQGAWCWRPQSSG